MRQDLQKGIRLSLSEEKPDNMPNGLLYASLAGALAGALLAKWAAGNPALGSGLRLIRVEGSWIRSLMLALVFPLMLLLADLTQRKAGFLFAFFCRSCAAACLLCVSADCVIPSDVPVLIQTLLFRCLLPLPVFFFCADRLMRTASDSQGRSVFFLLFPAAAELLACLAELLLLA